MSGAFDEAEDEKRISFNGPDGKHLLQVALRARTASAGELQELASVERDAHWERLREIERAWGDPDEPPLAERWHERQGYAAICNAISNPHEYVRQAREQGYLSATEPDLKDAQSRSSADEAIDAPKMSVKRNLAVGENQPFNEQDPSLE